jgi:hypothetical protein
MKAKAILLSIAIAATVFTGCAAKETTTPPAEKPATEAKTETKTDVVTTASIVNEAAAFEKAISKDGTWIICTLNDLTFTKDLVLEGEFKNGKKDEKTGAELIQRKIAPYTQKKNAEGKNEVVDRFTITAPKLTIKSPVARLQAGTFKGDIYVETKDFQLVDAKVEGNIYFASEEAKAGFKMDDKSTVSGKQEVKK